MTDPVELLFSEARRRLEAQEKRIDDIRTRTLTILGAAGVVMGLFGLTLNAHHLHGVRQGLAVGALVAFVAVAICTVLVQWRFDLDTGDLLANWLDQLRTPGEDIDEFASVMAHSFDDALVKNRKGGYARIARASLAAYVAFGLEVIAWAVSVV